MLARERVQERRSARRSGRSGRRRWRAWGAAVREAGGARHQLASRILPAIRRGPGRPSEYRILYRRYRYTGTFMQRMLPAYAELHCLSNFSFLRGASHPGGARRARAGARLRGARDHRRMLGRRRRARASRGEGRRAAARHRQRVHARRRHEARAARHRPRRATATSSQLITRGRRSAAKGTLRADARRRRGARAALPRAVAAARSARGRSTRPAARCGALRSRDVFAGRAWIAVELFARAGDRARLDALRGARRARPACRWSPPATCTCTCARGARCRTR